MDAKISADTWSDPELETGLQEVLLTLLWVKTNRERNDCGAYRFSASRFTLETKLDPAWHEKTMAFLPDRFAKAGHWVLYIPFIRECLQLGTVEGKNGGINLGAKALTKPFKALPKPLQDVLLGTYPELSVVWPKPLLSPCEALPGLEGLGKGLVSPSGTDTQSVAPPKRSEKTAAPEGLGKGLVSPREEKSRAAKRREEEGMQGEGTGDALIPSEEDVLTFGRQFQDLARGLGPIPESYSFKWLAWRMSEKAGPFPRDWKKDLRMRFLADAEDKKTVRPQTEAPRASRKDIEAELQKLTDPSDPRRGPLLAKLNQHAA